MRAARIAMLSLALISAPGYTKKYAPPPMPAGYDDPGPIPEQPLAQIASVLRSTLVDPNSVQNFSLCQSRVMEAREPGFIGDKWRKAYLIIHYKLNSKNGFGGYTGLQAGIAEFADGKITKAVLIGSPLEEEPARSWREPCERVNDAEIQNLLKN